MIVALGRALASLSLMLKQPLPSFCDVETAHGDALVTKQGDYVSWLRLDGMRRMSTRQDVERIALGQRLDLSGTLEERGHAIVGFYISDPEASGVHIDHATIGPCREVARQVGLDLTDILDERRALWPRVMRWEAAYFVLWTRKAVLTNEERKQVGEEQKAIAMAGPLPGESQRYFTRSEIMLARHDAFVSRVAAALRAGDIAVGAVTAHEALSIIRETIYRETAGSAWKATLPGDRVMPRIPDDEARASHPGHQLWPNLASQIFHLDAVTQGGQRVQIGDHVYAPIDMALGPEEPRSFIELSAVLGADRIPWRFAAVIEGGGRTAMTMKEIGASFLAMFPQNADLRRAFQALHDERATHNHIAIKLRASFATWAPVDDMRKLRRRASTLAQRIEGWGNCKATTISGDPLEGLMSSAPGLALASTATPSLALLGDAPADDALEPYRFALDGRFRAVPPPGWRHLALRSIRRVEAPAGAGHLRGAPALREVRAGQHHQPRPVPQLRGAGRQGRAAAADRQVGHRGPRRRGSSGCCRRRSAPSAATRRSS